MSMPPPSTRRRLSRGHQVQPCAELPDRRLVRVPDGSTMTFPMCAWADDNTNGSVAVITPATATQSPEDVDVDSVAEMTVTVREELRKPIG
ncbi:hypothetical protein [Streptomyces sp. NPDC002889]|uniref:hypothetical protein n=1 Tax=Streptomyces sp. NPDC002889 TaxID=3364669 RepID=UPI00368C22D9